MVRRKAEEPEEADEADESKVIIRAVIPADGHWHEVRMPFYAEVKAIWMLPAMQVSFCYERFTGRNAEAHNVTRLYRSVNTNEEFPVEAEYIGTALSADGDIYARHLIEMRP